MFVKHLTFSTYILVMTLVLRLGLTIMSSNSIIIPLFEKMLSAIDAGRIGRLVLPKKCAEEIDACSNLRERCLLLPAKSALVNLYANEARVISQQSLASYKKILILISVSLAFVIHESSNPSIGKWVSPTPCI
ncbi:uncharacterized protein LOC111302388 [Durio zibethinus]|uniref:Uncharacterized protein LOC111302388 n=1 Tax=Durio zibethinus TaxID=66656 RepID=A0A6P5ZNU6_DURZI|nr:uncharacterized protein LOC111302388 [Durio zibethinus]